MNPFSLIAAFRSNVAHALNRALPLVDAGCLSPEGDDLREGTTSRPPGALQQPGDRAAVSSNVTDVGSQDLGLLPQWLRYTDPLDETEAATDGPEDVEWPIAGEDPSPLIALEQTRSRLDLRARVHAASS